MCIYKIGKNENYVLKIIQDDMAESPREWDNLGTMVCWHRRYNLGDKHDYDSPEEFLRELADENIDPEERYVLDENDYEVDVFDDMSMNQLLELARETNVILPLYLYDHSGITMNTGGFSCPWDSGQVGWIYCSKNRFIKETGYTEDELFNQGKAEEYLKGEVKTYDDYLRGDVYGYQLFKINKGELFEDYQNEKIETMTFDELEPYIDEIDSCWGFYGDNFLENGVLDYVGMELKDLVNNLEYVF